VGHWYRAFEEESPDGIEVYRRRSESVVLAASRRPRTHLNLDAGGTGTERVGTASDALTSEPIHWKLGDNCLELSGPEEHDARVYDVVAVEPGRLKLRRIHR
jgi:hypothetical protein